MKKKFKHNKFKIEWNKTGWGKESAQDIVRRNRANEWIDREEK